MSDHDQPFQTKAVRLGRKALHLGAEAFRNILDFYTPVATTCAICGGLSDGHELCRECADILERRRITEPVCPVCGYPLHRAGQVCLWCQSYQLKAKSADSIWRYQWPANALILTFKNHNGLCGERMGWEMAEWIKAHGISQETVLTWVTPGRKVKRYRGRDRDQHLAFWVSDLTGLRCVQLLDRVNTEQLRQQKGLSAAERQTNVRGTFTGRPEAAGLDILLLDDVLTTGATLNACTEALYQAGAASVRVLTAARVLEHDDRAFAWGDEFDTLRNEDEDELKGKKEHV